MITYYVCIYLIGALIAWLSMVGLFKSHCTSISNPYDSVRAFTILWERDLEHMYNWTKRNNYFDYLSSGVIALGSWVTLICLIVIVPCVLLIERRSLHALWTATHLIPEKSPSKEEVKNYLMVLVSHKKIFGNEPLR
jgi:hypothetical protein